MAETVLGLSSVGQRHLGSGFVSGTDDAWGVLF